MSVAHSSDLFSDSFSPDFTLPVFDDSLCPVARTVRRRARFSVPYQGDLFVHYLLGHRYSRGDVRQPVGDFMDAGPQSVSGITLSFVSVLRSYDTENVFVAFPRFI